MDRRIFLTGLSTLGLTSCQFFADPKAFQISLLSGSIPSQLVKKFEQIPNPKVKINALKTYQEIQNIFAKNEEPMPDLISLGDAWLPQSIYALQPIDPDRINKFSQLQTPWESVIKGTNRVWGIPYRWGTTVIVYQKERLKKAGIPPIRSWNDLWHPKLQRRITLPDNFREVIGLVLKTQGFSYNQTNIREISRLKNALVALNHQVLTYTSTHYIHSLLTEDSWVAVGWSADFWEILKRYPTLSAIIPEEGSALWCDLWSIPKTTNHLDLAYAWINFCLELESSKLITTLTNASATFSAEKFSNDPIKLPNQQTLKNCETIQELSKQTEKEYIELWEEIRQRET